MSLSNLGLGGQGGLAGSHAGLLDAQLGTSEAAGAGGCHTLAGEGPDGSGLRRHLAIRSEAWQQQGKAHSIRNRLISSNRSHNSTLTLAERVCLPAWATVWATWA